MRTNPRAGSIAFLALIGLGLAVLSVSAPRAVASELVETLQALRAEKDPERRIALVPELARLGGERAAEALGRLVRKDPDVRVRLAAARGLGEIEAENIREVLVAAVRYGGPLRVRKAVAHALRKQDLGDELIRLIEWPQTPPMDRELMLAALAQFKDAGTRDMVHRYVRSPDPGLREVAVRASAERLDAGSRRLRFFVELLASSRDRGVLLVALDTVVPFLHPVMRPALQRLARSPDEDIAASARHVLRNLARSEAAAAKARAAAGKKGAKKGKDDRYAEPTDDPPVPGRPGDGSRPPATERIPRRRVDLVWVMDATGSTIGTLGYKKARIFARMEAEGGGEQSVRVGIVVFRGGHFARDHRAGLSVLPLTVDRRRVAAFLGGIRSRGVDDRGSAVPMALHVALDQMAWRKDARREVRFEADGGCRKPAAAKATVSMHYRAARTRTLVTFTRRTRKVIPPELQDLAALGGSELILR